MGYFLFGQFMSIMFTGLFIGCLTDAKLGILAMAIAPIALFGTVVESYFFAVWMMKRDERKVRTIHRLMTGDPKDEQIILEKAKLYACLMTYMPSLSLAQLTLRCLLEEFPSLFFIGPKRQAELKALVLDLETREEARKKERDEMTKK